MAFNRLTRKLAQAMPPMGMPAADPMQMGGGALADPTMGAPPGDPMAAAPADPSMGGEAPQQFTLGSLTNYIDQDPETAMELLKTKVPNAQVEFTDQSGQKRLAELWGLLEPENWKNADDGTKGQVAGLIQENLPPEMKVQENMGTEDSNVVPATKQVADIQSSVAASNEVLRKVASQIAGKTVAGKKSFNLSRIKTAEGLPVEVYPLLNESTSIDNRTMQPINNRDIIERNKGWGMRPYHFFSQMGIDYDNFWQTHVMDKFYEPYRDKDGQWVGGYLEKRFETDKNIPEFNNMQLKPGERRKPARATLLEGKLEESRGGKAFNWVKAKSAAAIKTAQGAAFEQEKYDFGRGEEKVTNASDAQIQYALDDLKQTIDIQEADLKKGAHVPKLGYYWDEYHTYVGEKSRRIKEGRWNPSTSAEAPDSQLPPQGQPSVGDPMMDLDDENYIDGKKGKMGMPPSDSGLMASTASQVKTAAHRARACNTCGTAVMAGTEGDTCPACVKSQADDAVREAALQKKK